MIIDRDTQTCRVKFSSRNELEWLSQYLCFEQGKGRFSKRINYLRSRGMEGSFPSGLFKIVLHTARKEGLTITVNDLRVRPEGTPTLHPALDAKLHYYQREAWAALFRSEAAVAELPTGSGKTLISAGLLTALPGRALYLVGDAVLAQTTADCVMEETGEEVGTKLGAANRVVCATFQSVYAALKKAPVAATRALSAFEMIVIDEAHMVPADTFSNVVKACPAYWRFALSATPFDRSDGKSMALAALLGPRCYKKTEGELAEEGYISRADIRMVRFRQPDVFLGKYDKAYELEIVKSEERNNLIVRIADVADKPALVLYEHLDHGKILYQKFKQAGVQVALVSGTTHRDVRLSIIERLNNGQLSVVLASRVFNVGVNVPELAAVIMARAGASTIMSVQGTGRVLRKTASKSTGQVWDVYDWCENVSKGKGVWVCKHARERLKTYLSRGHDVRVGDSVRPDKWHLFKASAHTGKKKAEGRVYRDAGEAGSE